MKWKFAIPSKKNGVQLIVERGVLQKEAPKFIDGLDRPIALITDETVASLHAETFCGGLERCQPFTFPAGENSKTQTVATDLQQRLLAAGLGRDAAIVGMGGGVVTDLAGFVASTYCRGVPLVLVPTTLLAMVDAGIGGKTGINLAQNKNYIGTIYQPEAIFIDPDVLATQPLESFRDGMVEMVKHGLIADVQHFAWIEEHVEELLQKELLEKGIADSCLIKMSVVLQDAHEGGMRRILNFGHTIGHALETLSGYKLSHGTAVAIGSLVEAHLSDLAEVDLLRIARLFTRMGVPLEGFDDISTEAVLRVMSHDKKAVGSTPRFVTLQAIGRADRHGGAYCTFVEESKLKKALEWMHHDLCEFARS